MKMTFPAFVILAASLQCCLGQSDANVLAISDWSAPVGDAAGFTLRGRLRLEERKELPGPRSAWFYLELQNFDPFPRPPIEIRVNPNTDLAFEMRDGHNDLVNPVGVYSINSPLRDPFTATLIPDSTLKLPVGSMVGFGQHDPRLILWPLGGGPWPMPRGGTNEYFLSATFTPPADKQSALNYHLWQGTLILPKLKMPVDKIKDLLGMDK
jgi:hypothetical protein